MHPLVPRFIVEKFAKGEMDGRFPAAVLFADVAGFTPLTAAMFQHQRHGAEVLSNVLDEVLGQMVAEVEAREGIIPLFAGDGFFAVFSRADAAHRAWHTAVTIHHFFQSARGPFTLFATPYGIFEIGVKLGLALGEVAWGILGADDAHTFYFGGDTFDRCGEAEKLATRGDIIAHETILAQLPKDVTAVPIPHPPFSKLLPPSPLRSSAPSLPRPSAPSTRSQLRPFISDEVLDFQQAADFRFVCPVFISFQTREGWPELVTRVIHLTRQYSGTFNRLDFGDKGGMMVLWFGAPIGYEDNVTRAAECLLALQKAQLPASVSWRAGLTYGLVWAGFRGSAERMEYGCLGDVVNTAARTVMQTAWGEIWLDEGAARVLRNKYQLTHVGNFHFKGKEGNHVLYRLATARRVLQTVYQGEMVGRQAELVRLREAVEPVFDGRFAGTILIYGEAGMGKSRLAFALHQQLGERVNWLTCPADDLLRQSLNPFRTLLKSWFGQSTDHPPAENRAQFEQQFRQLVASLTDERATAVVTELSRTHSFLAALVDLTIPGSLYERLEPKLRFENTLQALVAFLRAQSLRQPVILHLEDTHWLDADSQQFVSSLPRLLPGYPVVILSTSRYPEDGRAPPPFTDPVPTVIDLNAFTDADLQTLCQQLLGTARSGFGFAVADPVIQFLQNKSEGNPFFAEQLILELQEQGLLKREESTYSLVHSHQDILPASLNTLLIARLDRLPPPVKEVVQTAAILGQQFTLPVLAAMLDADSGWAAKVQQAAEKQIWTILDELRTIFKHALLRDAAYTMQLHGRLRQLHRRAAQAYETLYAADPSPYYSELAYHYRQAGDESQERGYTRLAGEAAARRFDQATAVTYLSRALELTPKTDVATQINLLLAREGVYDLQGKREEQWADLTAVAHLSSLTNPTQSTDFALLQDMPNAMLVARRWAGYANAVGDFETAVLWASHAVTLAQTLNQAEEIAQAQALWGRARWHQGDYAAAAIQYQQGLTAAQQASHQNALAANLNGLGLVHWNRGDYADAQSCFEQALLIRRQTGDRQGESGCLTNLGNVAWSQGDYGRARAYDEQSLAIRQEIGDRMGVSHSLNNLGAVAKAQSQLDRAEAYYRQSLALFQEIDGRQGMGMNYNNLGVVVLQQGEYTAALSHFQQALDLYQEVGDQLGVSICLSNLGVTWMEQGEYEEAQATLLQSLAVAQAVGSKREAGITLHELGALALAQQDWDNAQSYYEQSFRLRQEIEERCYLAEDGAGLAWVALARGDAATARELIEPVLAYLLENPTLDGAENQVRVWRFTWEVLVALQDGRAEGVLRTAVQFIQSQLAHISDPARQEMVLARPHHRVLWAAGDMLRSA